MIQNIGIPMPGIKWNLGGGGEETSLIEFFLVSRSYCICLFTFWLMKNINLN